MAHWTAEEKGTITSTWATVNQEIIDTEALARLLIVYPWTQKYFESFGDLSSPAAIESNSNSKAQVKKFLATIDKAIHHLDNMKQTLGGTSKEGPNELYADHEGFKHFGDMVVEEAAKKTGHEVPPKAKQAWKKFMNTMVDALN